MKKRHWIALAAIFTLAAPMVDLKAQEDLVYTVAADEVPTSYIIEDFLHLASGWYEGDRDAFDAWCREYSIDPTLPSAHALGEAAPRIEREYLERINRVYRERRGGHNEPDPNIWKPTAMGRVFGEVYNDLRSEGLPWDLEQFLLMIDTRMRPETKRYSDEPFSRRKLATKSDLFWSGLASTSDEARRLVAARRSP